jgi:hypothetical protein
MGLTLLLERDITEVLATDHHSSLTGLTPDSDPDTIFTGNSSCILSPDVTEGPYCKLLRVEMNLHP